MFIEHFRQVEREKLMKKAKRLRKRFIRAYIKALFKRNDKEQLTILEDICYQLYTYGYIMHAEQYLRCKGEKK